MSSRRIFKVIITAFAAILMCAGYLGAEEQSSYSPSLVYVSGNNLMFAWRCPDGSLEKTKPLIFRGVTWAAATQAPHDGPNPLNNSESVPYGFFFDWEGRSPQGHEVFAYWLTREYAKYYDVDIGYMKRMNVNVVRVYTHFGLAPREYTRILDKFYDKKIMVILTVAGSKREIDSGEYLKVVNAYKDHPAILMWSLGNEWNLDYNRYHGYQTIKEAAQATDHAAGEIKKIDPGHPVSTCLGDRFVDDEAENTVAAVVQLCPNIDIWGFNVYRGKSFGSLFSQWEKISEKPMYISEFGTDSFYTQNYKIANDFQAIACVGQKDEDMQAQYILGLWEEISDNLSALYENKQCLGGLVHEFNDELWKVGCYHVDMGDMIDYDFPEQGYSYTEYNTEGFYLPGGHPDDVANEEFFGVMDAQRNPKKVFIQLQNYYEKLSFTGEYTFKGCSDAGTLK
ncbi:MAG: glycoside hydrolase family 2 TIM barrel-domain containing protein [Candidatus Omnitrophota bacterium]